MELSNYTVLTVLSYYAVLALLTAKLLLWLNADERGLIEEYKLPRIITMSVAWPITTVLGILYQLAYWFIYVPYKYYWSK